MRFKPIIRWNTAVLSCTGRERLQSRAGDLMKVKRKALWERQLLAAVIYFLEFHVARDAWVLGRKLGKMVS